MVEEISQLRNQLEELKKKRARAESDLMRHEAKRDALLDALKNEFGLDSTDAGVQRVEKLQKELSEKALQLNALVTRIEEKLKVYV